MGKSPTLARQDDVSPRSAAPDRRSVGGYFALSYTLSWSWLLGVAVAGGLVVAGHGWPTHFPALVGPLVAAVVLTVRREGRAGLRDLLHRMTLVRVPLRWWLFAVSPLLLLALVVAVDAVAGQPLPAHDDFAMFGGLSSGWGVPGVALALLLVNGFGEETGWRGYALPALQRRHSPLVATVILAALWAAPGCTTAAGAASCWSRSGTRRTT